MPHEWCQQSGDCWLSRFFSSASPSGLPKFRIGQIVHIVWTDDDEQEHIDTAEIFGIVQACEGWLLIPGWWYVIRVTHENGKRLSYRTTYEEIPEGDLQEIS